MNENKTQWEVDQIKRQMNRNTEDINSLKEFKTKTIEQLKTIFNRLKDIEKTNKWVSQSFFYLILSGVIGAVFF